MKTPAQQVIEFYPNAKPVKVGKLIEIQYLDKDRTITLGKGKNNRCAWKSASRNIS